MDKHEKPPRLDDCAQLERVCKERRQPIALQVGWRKGERSPAWDEMWRRILRGALAARHDLTEKAQGLGQDEGGRDAE